MYVGTQFKSRSDDDYRVFAQLGVEHICGNPPGPTGDADLEEVYNTERHLLYVACTRARDHLLVTSVEPASEFLDDLRM